MASSAYPERVAGHYMGAFPRPSRTGYSGSQAPSESHPSMDYPRRLIVACRRHLAVVVSLGVLAAGGLGLAGCHSADAVLLSVTGDQAAQQYRSIRSRRRDLAGDFSQRVQSGAGAGRSAARSHQGQAQDRAQAHPGRKLHAAARRGDRQSRRGQAGAQRGPALLGRARQGRRHHQRRRQAAHRAGRRRSRSRSVAGRERVSDARARGRAALRADARSARLRRQPRHRSQGRRHQSVRGRDLQRRDRRGL